MDYIHFAPRWKEELVATSKSGKLVFEFTMGVEHVYFPSKELWEKQAPDWAKDKWEEYMKACTNWSESNRYPMSIVDNTFMYELKE
ncbi:MULTISPECIES: hypothetical protein [unclassified Paraflavitalea]|uniref:hypothetical protein n=1 Tax=unclassified Paraflavitalea TaxID=2798305 RepID=UPI003D35849F